ncbi:MAG: HEAT repeat domain-containing protein [bacterium]
MPRAELIANLQHPDPDVRRAIIERLRMLDTQLAAGALVFLLSDPEPDIRARVSAILSSIGKPAIVPVVRYLEDWKGPLDTGIPELLGELYASEGIDFLLKHLNEDQPAVRAAIARALGKIGTEKAVPGLLELLRDTAPEVQIAAAEALGTIGSAQAVNPLLDELNDHNPAVRKSAAEALGKIRDKSTASILARLVSEDPSPEVRATAERALQEISDRSVQYLLQSLTAESPNERSEALNRLLASGHTAIPPLIRLLGHPDPHIRSLAAEVLGILGEPAALDALSILISDREGAVRLAVVRALGKIHHIRAAEKLSQALLDSDPKVAGMAANSLTMLGELAIEPVFSILGHHSAEFRARAIDVLGHLRHRGACERLINGLTDSSSWVRIVSAQALGEIGAQQAVPALINSLDDPNRIVRAMAAEALGKICDYRASIKLLELVEDESELVRTNVLRALGMIGNPAAIPFLLKAIDDPETEVRIAAIEGLAQLRAKTAVERLRAIARRWPWSREPKKVKVLARWALAVLLSVSD